MSRPDATQAASFGVGAESCERGRPRYPRKAVDWLVPPGARRVLDLGAGTGKLTRQLVELGLEVVAVERAVRAELTRVLPDVRTLAGSAEEIPLDDGAVDVVLVAQAWHWVAVERAVPEVARVLAPGGQLGLVWNERDERSDWVARLGALMHRGMHRGIEQNMGAANPRVGRPFGPVERLDVEWSYGLARDALLDLVASRGYIITLPDGERADVLAHVRALLDTHPDLAGTDEIALPYVTRCSRATLG